MKYEVGNYITIIPVDALAGGQYQVIGYAEARPYNICVLNRIVRYADGPAFVRLEYHASWIDNSINARASTAEEIEIIKKIELEMQLCEIIEK